MTALEVALGHRFADPELLQRALTHASYVNEHPPAVAQDGLAFVGDAALGLVIAERLLAREPTAPVGVLTPALQPARCPKRRSWRGVDSR